MNQLTFWRLKPWRTLALVGLTLSAAWSWAAPNKVALLVGVGQYPDKSNQLQGPANDVAALRQVLIERWGYEPGRIQSLVDQGATRQAIVRAMGELMARTQAGDEVLVYFSGHGTSALDPGLGLPLPDGSGAFIPVDADLNGNNVLGQLLVGRTDLRPVFEQLDQGGRKVWFISDSCFSGQQVRSAGKGLPARMIPLAMDAQTQSFQSGAREQFQQRVQRPQDWPYRNVVFLAAAAEGEFAKDIPAASLRNYPTIDGLPHGAMTDALLRVLVGQIPSDADGDGQVSLHEVHQAVGRFMAQRAYGHTPQRLPSVQEDAQAAGQRALLTGKGVLTAQSQDTQPALRVSLQPGVPDALRRRAMAVPGLQLVAADQPAQVRLSQSRDGQFMQISSSGGDVITRVPMADAVALAGSLQQLAWVERMDALAIQSRRAILPAEVAPAALGGNFRVGDAMHFVVRPDRDAYVMLLNVDSTGKVSVLYPYQPRELEPVKAKTARAIPGEQPQQRIQVTEPLGMDVQLVFAFDEMPPKWARWVQQLDMPPGDPRLTDLEKMVQAAKGRLTYARTELRVDAATPRN